MGSVQPPSTPETAYAVAADASPLVTLYVAAYNQEPLVREAVAGAFAQTYQPLEIVLSDDCSEDGTFTAMEEMAASYSGPHSVVLNRNPENLGIPAHVDRIVEIASGRLIVQNAGDDVSLPGRVSRLVEVWQGGQGRIKALHSAKFRIDERGQLLGRQVDHEPIDGHSALALLRDQPSISGASMAWDREVFDVFGPLGTTPVFEDYPICLRAATIGDVVYVDEPLLNYRLGGLSASRVEPMGWFVLYGHRRTFISWHLSFSQLYAKDLERFPADDMDQVRAQCAKNIRDFSLDLDLSQMSHKERFAALPAAAWSSLKHRDPAKLRSTLKYCFDGVYMPWLNWRYGTFEPGVMRKRPGT